MMFTPKNKHILKVVQAPNNVLKILFSCQYFFGMTDMTTVNDNLASLFRHHQRCSVDVLDNKSTVEAQRPKLHCVIAHLRKQSELVNPKWVQGYNSE